MPELTTPTEAELDSIQAGDYPRCSGCPSPDPMALPAGKTCSDCAHFRRCVGLFSCKPTNTHCDWSPSRFLQGKPEPVAAPSPAIQAIESREVYTPPEPDGYCYSALLIRMYDAAARLRGMKAARMGMHWERWANRHVFGSKGKPKGAK